ncbi:uroporphyrinogen-III C-methyltransferase, partial [Ralstonia pseudosolanacearum]
AATTPQQRSACFTLQQMAEGAAAAWIHPEHPSLLMIGEAFAGRAASAAPAQCPGAPHVLAA